jgi:hypothetical protein
MQKVGIDNRSGARHRPSNGQAISADGWRVALLDIDEETLNGSVAGLPDSAVNLAICCDVADAAGVTKAFASISSRAGTLSRRSFSPPLAGTLTGVSRVTSPL